MNTFVCQSLLYIFANHCRLNENNEIVPITGNNFQELFSREKIIFSQKPESKSGNIFFNQSLSIVYPYSDVTILQQLTNSHLILKIQKTDGSYYFWGSLEPYNPVQSEIKTEAGTVEISFFRQSHIVEF